MANAAHTLMLAEQHGARSLKVAALRFVAANAVAVMKTDGWKHMAAARPTLLSEVSVLVQFPLTFVCCLTHCLSGGARDGNREASAG